MQKTDRQGLFKSKDAVISTDNKALEAYRKHRNRLRNINILEDQVKELKVLYENAIKRIEKLEGK